MGSLLMPKEGDVMVDRDRGREYKLKTAPSKKKRDQDDDNGNRIYVVEKAVDENGKEFFLKFTHVHNGDDICITCLEREARFRFSYPYLMCIVDDFKGYLKDVDDPDNNFKCVMSKRIEGESLTQFAKRLAKEREEGRLTQEDYDRKVFRQITEILYGVNYYVNSGLEKHDVFLHRDIKPDNVMIRTKNRDAVLVDFDASHIAGSTDTQTMGPERGHGLVGTPGYTDPRIEEHNGKDYKSGIQADLYALGRTIFYWLDGRHYYQPEMDRGCAVRSGYGLDPNRFRCEAYKGEAYQGLRTILEKMCGDDTMCYRSVWALIRDWEDYLDSYCGKDVAYQDYFDLNTMPLLQNRTRQDTQGRFQVTYQYNREERSRGGAFRNHSMTDINDPKGSPVMIIYVLDGAVYYIPLRDGLRREPPRGRDGEENDYTVRDGDTFRLNELTITFNVRPI